MPCKKLLKNTATEKKDSNLNGPRVPVEIWAGKKTKNNTLLKKPLNALNKAV